MSPDQVSALANTTAILSWVLLALLPARGWVTPLTGTAVPALLALVYTGVVATTFGRAEGSFGTLAGVAQLFSSRWLLLAGWVHYLAFDLLIGTWEARDAAVRGMPRMVLIVCLFGTLMFGPAGWLLYIAVRTRWRGTDVV